MTKQVASCLSAAPAVASLCCARGAHRRLQENKGLTQLLGCDLTSTAKCAASFPAFYKRCGSAIDLPSRMGTFSRLCTNL